MAKSELESQNIVRSICTQTTAIIKDISTTSSNLTTPTTSNDLSVISVMMLTVETLLLVLVLLEGVVSSIVLEAGDTGRYLVMTVVACRGWRGRGDEPNEASMESRDQTQTMRARGFPFFSCYL